MALAPREKGEQGRAGPPPFASAAFSSREVHSRLGVSRRRDHQERPSEGARRLPPQPKGRNKDPCRIVASVGAGLDHLDPGLVASFGVKAANTPHAVSSRTADLGMALLLAAARRVMEGHQLAISPHTENLSTNWMA
ncbi:hypothetical protein J1605_010392 [Eschrichtius robustus]|uniref:D-isomer specific 2-hydroxyacid dehydrogenase catalytic domain-containing protein n=1 Tax=Eschrichtius robustus TaxID=9764 RepID=A0AB34GUA1_ESCRO|nr:hypothetical protein J1605_010392 [Eschrichtius robustus]